MSESAEMFGAIKDHKKRVRAAYGVDCPECRRMRPRTNPTKLLPQQKCRVDGYVDPRPALTDEQWGKA